MKSKRFSVFLQPDFDSGIYDNLKEKDVKGKSFATPELAQSAADKLNAKYKSKRGGKRTGSGRNKVEDPKQTVTIGVRESKIKKHGIDGIRDICRKAVDQEE